LQHDSRENQESPNSGQFFELSSMAYRESLGGDENFNTIRGKFVQYLPHGDNHVMAVRAQGRWTSDDAPRSAFSTVDLRGYVRGNYLAPNSTLLEVEERFHLNKRWSLAGFLSVACLYDRLKDCKGNDNLYPAAGGGVIYTIKPKEKMVMRMDAAFGKGDNTGFYLRFGHPF
jgi:hypothetical protein